MFRKFNYNFFKKPSSPKSGAGFTLIEIVVATTIFAIVFAGLLSLYNYVLKINRRSEALRQASQGMRSFVEFLVKEIRNGQIDYYVSNGKYVAALPGAPCGPAVNQVGATPKSTDPATYNSEDNKLGIINTDSQQECFYFGDDAGPTPNYVGAGIFTAPVGHSYTLMMQKTGVSAQKLNPPNFQISQLMFLIRPLCDPKTINGCSAYSNPYPDVQPSVVIFMEFVAHLPTGEQVPIYYQTSVSSDKYDLPQ